MNRAQWKELTPEEQTIKVAVLCEWRMHPLDHGDWCWEHDKLCVVGGPRIDESRSLHISIDGLPDYLNDLNAMHEAEELLDGVQDNELLYAELLNVLTSGMEHKATAAQRAEAFVLTMADRGKDTA